MLSLAKRRVICRMLEQQREGISHIRFSKDGAVSAILQAKHHEQRVFMGWDTELLKEAESHYKDDNHARL